MVRESPITEKGLPANPDAERFVLGSILLNDAFFVQAAGRIKEADFSLEKHRRIFRRMSELQERGEKIERMTVIDELIRYDELEACDGIGYIISLDDSLPQIPNLDAYVRIVKDKSLLRQIIFASQNTMNRCLLQEDRPESVLSSAGQKLLDLSTEYASGKGPATAKRILDDYEGGIEAFLSPAKRKKGISTGFPRLDEMTGGLRGGELFVLAARPSMGKTALALDIVRHTAVKLRLPALLFSLEMSKESLLTRMVCATARVDSQRFRMGYLTQDERHGLLRATQEIYEAPIEIDDTAAELNILELQARAMRIASKYGKLGLIAVDYLQLMEGDKERRRENRNQEVSALSRGLKILSKKLDTPVLALSQLSRAVETRGGDHRPTLSDLRDSGSIEQDADIVGFIFREEVYHRDREDLRGLAELILAKQREGPIGTVNLVFLHVQTRFESRAEDVYQEEYSQ